MQFSSRQTQALAASVAAMMIVAPLAFQHLKSKLGSTFTTVSTGLSNATSSQAPAPTSGAPPRGDSAQRSEQASKAYISEPKKKDVAPSPEPRDAVARQESDAKVAAAQSAASAPAAAAPATTASQELSKLRIGKQSLGADNAALGIDYSVAADDAPAAAPKPAEYGPALAMGRTADSNSALGRRMMESDKYAASPELKRPLNPYEWMGHADEQRAIAIEQNRDKFNAQEINPVKQVSVEPVSTFSLDVDTASYSFVRRALTAGHLPPKDAVRVEEMINYFPYNYPGPETAETPFKPTLTVMPAPWNPNNQLVHVAIKGYDLKSTERPRANLVLLMDVSGSMQPEDRLPLVKNAFRMLLDQLKPDDTVGIVTYASGSGIALAPTRVADKGRILAAIDQLGAGGSTAGAQGIQDAYRLAEAGFDKSAVNRIILATDGDFNVGITDQNELKGYIERKRQSGIFLSILGVGQGNHNDALMQTLAQNGNGTAAYVDTLSEARKVLVDESSSTLFTIAKDVKVQIEWNPERVAEYRLIGYESRALKREDFNNDKVDAGDIGSGHTVTQQL